MFQYRAFMQKKPLDYLKHVLAVTGMTPTALARLINVSSTTLTRPLNDTDHSYNLSLSTVEKIEQMTGVAYSQETQYASQIPKLKLVQNNEEPPDDMALIQVFDITASAGFGALVDYEQKTHSLAFPPDYLRKLTNGGIDQLAIIGVKGDSMEPTILDDDIVLIDMSKTHLGFEGMFVLRHNDTLLIKRASMAPKQGYVRLISDNEAYPDVDAEIADITVVGKVLWYGRKV